MNFHDIMLVFASSYEDNLTDELIREIAESLPKAEEELMSMHERFNEIKRYVERRMAKTTNSL